MLRRDVGWRELMQDYGQPYGGSQHIPDYYAGHAVNPSVSSSEGAALSAARAEIGALKAENAALKAEVARLQAGGGGPSLPAPHFYPPAYGAAPPPGYGHYAPPPSYGAGVWLAPPAAAPPPARPANPPLAINAENKRGPKGANLALFCIPNSYYDQHVFDLVKPYGSVVFCSVATHRDTGAAARVAPRARALAHRRPRAALRRPLARLRLRLVRDDRGGREGDRRAAQLEHRRADAALRGRALRQGGRAGQTVLSGDATVYNISSARSQKVVLFEQVQRRAATHR